MLILSYIYHQLSRCYSVCMHWWTLLLQQFLVNLFVSDSMNFSAFNVYGQLDVRFLNNILVFYFAPRSLIK